jgi:hypothetical protein
MKVIVGLSTSVPRGEVRTKVVPREANSAIDILGSDRLHKCPETLLIRAVGSIA